MSSATWPKELPELSEQQKFVYEDWNKQFSGFVKGPKYSRISRFDHKFAAMSAAPELRTLEIGAGTGTHLAYESSGTYVAVERSAEAAELIPHRDGVQILIGDCEKLLPFEDQSFDRVLAIHILEHLYDLPSALIEVERVLKPTGLFSVVIPCEGGMLYALGRQFTSKRLFEKRYGIPYEPFIHYDHCNTATEVMTELGTRFNIINREYFPLKLPIVNSNVVIGLELRPLT